MSKQIEAMSQALEALEATERVYTEPAGYEGKYGKALDQAISKQQEKIVAARIDVVNAITALREALAEQPLGEATLAQQKPVVCKHEWFSTGAMETGQCRCIKCGAWNTTLPAQRTWVGLTDEDVMSIAFNFDVSSLSLVARAIEAKLKEKNNG